MVTVYIGLGSNLAVPVKQIEQALQLLDTLPNTYKITHSSLYCSTPLGPQNQPDYINAVAKLITDLPPLDLLSKLQAIETKQGRVRYLQRWGPRKLDLDILLYANQQLQTPTLSIPHPGLYERAFVLYPLYECAPNLMLPNGQHISIQVQQCSVAGLYKINH